jgi:integrase
LDGLVPRNVCEAVKPPKVERKEIKPLDREQTKALLVEASGHRLEALYVLAVHTGMREGELLGLKWEDVDLERGVLRLGHGLVQEGGKTALGDLKTPKSRRSVRLTRAASEALRSHLKRQLEEMERMGSFCQPGSLVFATQTGTLINPSNLRNRSFKPLLKRAGLRDICFHDLRHTCATLLLSQGTPEARPGASGTRYHSHDSRHLLALLAEHGGPDREGHGSSSHLEDPRCCTVAAQRPR